MTTSISLRKGENISLSKADASLEEVGIGLGWNKRDTAGEEFDLDASAYRLLDTKKCRGKQDFVFYGQLETDDGSVVHSGDNKDGGAEGDDETITVHLSKLPAEIKTVAVGVTIHEAASRRQSFGQVTGAYVRVYNRKTEKELARFDLTEDAALQTAMVFGELYRTDTEWKFRAVGQGYNDGIYGLASGYGLPVER